MGSMVLPELFAKSARFTITNAKFVLNKYKHLINQKKNASILEFGFADGSNSRQSLGPLLSSDYKEYIAADISKPMVEFAKNNVNLPKGEFVQFDIATENVPEQYKERFDNVFSLFTMHMNIAEQAFKNIHTILKPQGETFQILYKRLPLECAIVELGKYPRWSKYANNILVTPYLKSNPREVYEKFIRQANLKIQNFETESVTYRFPNEQAWKDLFFSVNPLAGQIKPEEMDDYKNDLFSEVRSNILHQNCESKEKDTLTFTAYIIKAKKL